MLFADRTDAGRRLADEVAHLRGVDAVVVGLPRGGVPVAAEVARALGAPLDVILVRKLGVPGHPELAMGALGEGGATVLEPDVLRAFGVPPGSLEMVVQRERAELERQAGMFRAGRPGVPLEGRTAVVVDDGVATGSTARAACQVARRRGARRVVLAVPVASPHALSALADVADETVCVAAPPDLSSVGEWYLDFSAVPDEEVVVLLDRAAAGAWEQEVVVGAAGLPGDLVVPAGAHGVVVFAHGSGSSRHSPRNRWVASVLNRGGLATLLFDLLHPGEEHHGSVFDVPLLGGRLADVSRAVLERPDVGHLPMCYFGASTGAAASLWAAAERDLDVAAIVSRGGRPDLAGDRLSAVRAPTLFVVGDRDELVLELNRRAARRLRCPHHVAVVPGAGHLFEEPGTLGVAANLALEWFRGHIANAPTREVPETHPSGL
jgi:putative phosphoribosyl transferase